MTIEPILPDLSHSIFLQTQHRLYQDMQHDIRLYQQKGLGIEPTIQGCFDIAHTYKAKLTAEVSGYVFENLADEVLYFRHLRPLFHAETEYHSYCYHVELFRRTVEDDDPLELELFYRRQVKRLEKFCWENRELTEYLMTGGTDRDATWFTRSAEDPESSHYDKTVGMYLALIRFEKYVQEKITHMNH
jgi:hypothetical protein